MGDGQPNDERCDTWYCSPDKFTRLMCWPNGTSALEQCVHSKLFLFLMRTRKGDNKDKNPQSLTSKADNIDNNPQSCRFACLSCLGIVSYEYRYHKKGL